MTGPLEGATVEFVRFDEMQEPVWLVTLSDGTRLEVLTFERYIASDDVPRTKTFVLHVLSTRVDEDGPYEKSDMDTMLLEWLTPLHHAIMIAR